MLICFFLCLLTQVQAATPSSAYKKISSILDRVQQTADLPDTVHRNPLVLEAVGLFLDMADTENLTRDKMIEKLSRLFPLPKWKEGIPAFEIEKLKSRQYLVSIGYAAVTQESSLYFFYDKERLKIDSGNGGLIHIEDVKNGDSRVQVTYLRTPGSTHPEEITAVLFKKDEIWYVTHVNKTVK
ncbi:MAG: hypothetical protein M0Z79_07420 [Nitrospiraceae bacterium]|nr:hypothetical protein [Nitrospiraceae bacterium]